MKNRLRTHWRLVFVFCNVFVGMILPGVNAQQGFFNFNYPGPNQIPVNAASCSNTLSGNMGTPVVSSKSGATITLSAFDPVQSMFQLTDLWNYGEVAHVYWKVADNQGHNATFDFYVTFVDTTKPVVITAGTPPLVSYNSIREVPPPPVLAATDSCSVTLMVTVSETTPPALCQGGTFKRTWTAKDDSGNTGVFTQTIVIYRDSLPPAVTVSPQNGSSSCTKASVAYPAWLAAQMAAFKATDPSGVAFYTNNAPAAMSGSCPPPLTVTFTASDSCGYAVTRTATFTVYDTHGPDVIKVPQDSVVACSPPANNHLFAIGDWIHRRARLAVQDSCAAANALSYSMRINGVLRDSAQVVAAFLSSFSNGCGPQQIGSQTYNKVRGSVKVDFFAKDLCGNVTYVGRGTFAAIDTVAPVLSGTPVVEQCGGGNDSLALVSWINNHGNLSVLEDCSTYTWTNFSWLTSGGESGGGTFGSGPYPLIPPHNCNWHVDVTFRATDDCGNTGSATLHFRINDTTPPVFSGLPPKDTLFCPNMTPPLPTAYVSDNCDNAVSLSSNFQIIGTQCSDAYTMLVTWLATDDCGNLKTATQTFVVRDTTHPKITLAPASYTVSCNAFSMPPNPVLGQDVKATDNCGDITALTTQVSSTQDPDPSVCGHYTYTVTRTFIVSDDCGNTSTKQQLIQVSDNIPPVLTGFADTTWVCDVQPVLPPPHVADICSGIASAPVLQNQVITAGNCPDSYTLTLTWASTDVCGNTGIFNQDILIVDTVKPTLIGVPASVIVECDAIPVLPPPGAITGVDNCDEEVVTTFQEKIIRDPNPANCAHWTNYMILREWTAADNCGNSRVYTQTITVQDNAGPQLVALDTVKTPAAPGLCGANVVAPSLLSVYDVCTAEKSSITLRDTVVLTPSGTPIDRVPVDTVVFDWPAPNLPPAVPVVGNAVLAVALDSADSELQSETFEIWGENGYHIGRTKQTNKPCGFSGDTTFTLPANLLNDWLTDGQLHIYLSPNGDSTEACNAYCSGGRARATLSYSVSVQQVPIAVSYSIDNGPQQNYPPSGGAFLDAGDHQVVYTATDCAGNSATAATVVRIEDLQPPMVIAPAAINAYVKASDCSATVSLPFPGLVENCGFSAHLNATSPLTPVPFEADPNAGLVPKNMILNIPGVLPNAVGSGMLKISHKGDNGNWGEFFRVLDEQNAFLGTTTNATSGECSAVHETPITVSAAQINAWAADGIVAVKLQSNRDVVNFTDFISPCGPLTGGLDGISTVQVALEYNYAVVEYEIRKGNQVVQSGQLTGGQTTAVLGPGTYTVQYRVTDSSGGQGMTTYPVVVRDTVAPKALCKPVTIAVNPSGLASYTLQPAAVNNGSLDNCSGANLTFQLSQTVFTCNQAMPPNDIYPVTLTVRDTSGNAASCQTTVRVTTETFTPTVTPGVCEGGTVQLFANPPVPNNGYTYLWNGPNGFISMNPDPFIPNASSVNEGTYIVTVTGNTGCTAVGTVLLDLSKLPKQPEFLNTPDLICEGLNLTLQCNVFGGTNVQYAWYSGTLASPTLLGTTTAPVFQITAPPTGAYTYFIKVSADGCTSLPSNLKSITVQKRPVATVVQSAISVCTCEAITLGTTVQGSGITYQWTGPGFPANPNQNPLVTSCAQDYHEGVYTLIVSQNGCASAPAQVTVDVREKPAKPVVTGNTSVCQGDTIILLCNNVPTAAEYRWINPSFSQVKTFVNTLLIANATLADSGGWRLQVLQNNCLSDPSDAKLVQVQAFPNVAATSNSPICQGSPLQLSANSTTSGVTFEWRGPNNFFAIGANPVVTMPVSGQYTATVSTPFGCTNTATAEVNVIALPVITSVTSTAPLCSDCSTDAVLQSTVFTQNGPVTYAWNGPGGFMSTFSEPVIPGVCADDNGSYNLVVKDVYGCVSDQKSTLINVQVQPERPLLGPDQALCVGNPFSISLQNTKPYPGNAVFEWHTPTGIVSQNQSKLNYPASTMQQSGTYWLVVKAGDCASPASDSVQITINPIPAAPVPAANTPVCEGDTLRFSASPIAGAQYAWTGVFGFTASVRDPFISQASKDHEGCYQVRATVNGCTSPPGEVCVLVKSRPAVPSILPISPVCLDNPGAVLTLKVAPPSATPLAQYIWYNAQTLDSLGPPAFPLTLQLSDLSTLVAGTNTFLVRARLNGCTSLPSAPMSVQADIVPPIAAFAGLDFAACDSFPFQLNATKPSASGVTGAWSQVGGPGLTIVDPPLFNSLVLGAKAGGVYAFSWSLSNGACKNYSADTVRVTSSAYEAAKAKQLIVSCSTDTVRLHATQGKYVAGVWTQPPGQALLQPPVVIENYGDPNTLVRNLPPNTYYFYWTLNTAGCAPSTVEVRVHTIGGITYAGVDQTICSTDSCTVLTAAAIDSFETGRWRSLNNPDAILIDSFRPSTKVCDLQAGENRFLWETNGGLCGNRSRDTIIVYYDLAPVAYGDSIQVPFGEKRTVNALLNDVVPPQFSIEVLEGPFHGKIEETAKGTYMYLPSLTFSGTDELTYRLCNLNPDCECSIASIKFEVGEAGDCRIPTIITPNGDGANDMFVIPPHCLLTGDGPSLSEVTIFNQWGDQVFHAQPYNNDWEGTYNGEPLPAGTYFYVVKLPAETEVRTGFLMIQR